MTGQGAQRPSAAAADDGLDWRRALESLRGAYADKTLLECAKDFRRFEAWCAARGLQALPAAPAAVAAHVDDIFPGMQATTVQTRVRAIRRVHDLVGHDDPTQAAPVKLAVRRGLRAYGSRRRQAAGLTAELRDRLLAACPDTLLGLRDRAMIGMGYDTLCRRAELVELRVEDITPLADGSARVQVRRSKSDPLGEGGAGYLSPSTHAAVRTWLAASGVRVGPILRPVFGSVAGERGANPKLVNQRLAALSAVAGIEPDLARRLSGHSFRVGAAQDLVAAGCSLLQIMCAGRWRRAEAVSRYARAAPVNVWAAKPAHRKGPVRRERR